MSLVVSSNEIVDATYKDGSLVFNSKEIQLMSLLRVLNFINFELVYSDSSVYVRSKEKKGSRYSFENAVHLHNHFEELLFTDDVSHVKLVHRIKLQRNQAYIDVQSHKIKPTKNLHFIVCS